MTDLRTLREYFMDPNVRARLGPAFIIDAIGRECQVADMRCEVSAVILSGIVKPIGANLIYILANSRLQILP